MKVPSVPVDCSFCGKRIECPPDMLETAKKHMCSMCFEDADNLLKNGEELADVHVDIPRKEFDTKISNTMTSEMVEDLFPEVWQERKEELKELSKRDLAEEMFGAGAYLAFRSMMESLRKTEKEMEEKNEGESK